MVEIGQEIYFKREGDKRSLKGTIINITPDGYEIQGRRTATKSTPPVFIIQAHEINTNYVPAKLRNRKLEPGHGNGLSIISAESIRRQQISTERLGMTETQILQARAMLEIRKRAVRHLAYQNRIIPDVRDFDFEELHSEYVVAQLTALRATAATATDADIREFKRYLAGETDDSRMVMTICRTSRTAAVRYLKRRAEYHHLHTNIDDVAYRLAA